MLEREKKKEGIRRQVNQEKEMKKQSSVDRGPWAVDCGQEKGLLLRGGWW